MRQVELPDILYKMQQIEESRMSLLKEQISSLEELFGTVDADHYPYPLSVCIWMHNQSSHSNFFVNGKEKNLIFCTFVHVLYAKQGTIEPDVSLD